MNLCYTSSFVIEKFADGNGFFIFGYESFTLTFISKCYAHIFLSLHAGRGLSFSLICGAFSRRFEPKSAKTFSLETLKTPKTQR